MLSLKLYGPGDIRLVETEIPKIQEGQILLKTQAAAICGTDIRMWQNGYKNVDAQHPLTLGHEFAGTIVQVGQGVPFFKEGMQVAMQPNIGCGICERCVAGKPHLCDSYSAFGINMDGAFAEYVRIPADAVLRGNIALLPSNVTAVQAAVAEPLSCAYNGFTKCMVQPGDKALIVGAGPIGVMHAHLLHMSGASVLMHDISQSRLAQCKQILPFIEVYDGEDLPAFVDRYTGGKGMDIAITANPVPSVQSAMLPLMNYGGRVNFFGGVPEDRQPVPINTNLVHYKELYLTGSTRSSIAQFRTCLDFIAQGLIDVQSVITHTYALEDSMQGFENAKNALGLKHVIRFS